MNEMQKSQPPLHIKNPQKNSLQHQKSKTIETKICKEVDSVRKFTVKFTTNPINGSEANKRSLRYTMCPKAM